MHLGGLHLSQVNALVSTSLSFSCKRGLLWALVPRGNVKRHSKSEWLLLKPPAADLYSEAPWGGHHPGRPLCNALESKVSLKLALPLSLAAAELNEPVDGGLSFSELVARVCALPMSVGVVSRSRPV